LNPLTSVGASGGIAGLAGFLIIFGWRNRKTLPERYVFSLALLVLLNAAAGLWLSDSVDNAAHLGGLVSGSMLGYLLIVRPESGIPIVLSPTLDRIAKCSQYATLGLALAAMALLLGSAREAVAQDKLAAQSPPWRWSPTQPYPMVDQDHLWKLVENHNFEEAERTLDAYKKGYQANWSLEEPYIVAYKAFDSCNGNGYALTQRWVDERPHSADALTARAYCEVYLGTKARGDKFANETSADQFKALDHWIGLAAADIERAIAVEPDNLAAYRLLVVVAKYQHSQRNYEAVAQRAIAKFPRSYFIWVNVIEGEQPKWFGSFDQIDELSDSAQAYVKDNPRLHVLLGYVDYLRGEDAWYADRFDDAYDWYTKALAYGDDHEYLMVRSFAARKLNRFEQARQDGVKAKTLFPKQGEESISELLFDIAAEERSASLSAALPGKAQ
jgi:hypothetical protein